MRRVQAQSGLSAHHVPMDGNCLYHAVADQLTSNMALNIDHLECRQNLVRNLPSLRKENPAIAAAFSIYSENDFLNYQNQTALQGTWGEHIELHCLSVLYKFKAVVYLLDETNGEICTLQLHEESSANSCTIHLALFSNHYWSLRKVPGSTPVAHALHTSNQKAENRSAVNDIVAHSQTVGQSAMVEPNQLNHNTPTELARKGIG